MLSVRFGSVVFVCLMLAACGGPVVESPVGVVGEGGGEKREGVLDFGSIRVEYEPVGRVANTGIQLPVVSPDGRHVAFIRRAMNGVTGADVLTSAEGVGWLSMYVQSLEGGGGKARAIAMQGACWPTWAADSRRLIYVVYTEDGDCSLEVYDIESREVLRLATDWRHIASPCVSPSGRFAVAAVERDGEGGVGGWGLGIIDLGGVDEPLEIPAEEGEVFAASPFWLDEYHIVYVSCRDGEIELRVWSIDKPVTRRVALLNIEPTTVGGVYQALASISEPLGSDKLYFVYYDAAEDEIAVVDLATGQEAAVFAGGRSATWWGEGGLVIGYGHRIELIGLEGGQGATVYEGQGLPLYGDAVGERLVMAIRWAREQSLQLLRVEVGR